MICEKSRALNVSFPIIIRLHINCLFEKVVRVSIVCLKLYIPILNRAIKKNTYLREKINLIHSNV